MNRRQEITKQWLSRPFKSRFLRRELEQAKENAEARATKITAELTGMPGSPSKDPHKFESAAILAAQIDEMIEKEICAKSEVAKAIDLLEDGREKTLLIARYVNYKQWDVIAEEMEYQPLDTSDGVFRLHRKALDSISNILEENGWCIYKHSTKV